MRTSINRLRGAAKAALIALSTLASAAACSGSGASAEPAKEPGPEPEAGPKVPAKAAQASAPSCPEGARWDGSKCAPGAEAAAAAGSETKSAEAAATPAPAASCPSGMVLVPGGTFKMDLRKEPVTVAPLCMDATEVTADAYAACVKGGQCSADNLKCAAQATYGAEGKGNHPMVCVDFTQATAYCKAQNKRLPSDEEWEWAARGGDEGRMYPWGNNAPKDQLCWSGVRTRNETCAVGSVPAGDTPLGIHDMAGNVFEWTTSRNDAKSKVRVGRGGSWKDGVPELVRASRPGGFEVTYRCGFLGIRCVLEAPPGAVPAK